jgi:hypothetical protein
VAWIVEPLIAWSQDPSAIAEIQDIAAVLERDPDAYVDLYPAIAQSYRHHSGRRFS